MSVAAEEVPYTIIHRGEGVLVVRVHSKARNGRPLPDTSFTFKPGDPQYESWKSIYNESHPDCPIAGSIPESTQDNNQ